MQRKALVLGSEGEKQEISHLSCDNSSSKGENGGVNVLNLAELSLGVIKGSEDDENEFSFEMDFDNSRRKWDDGGVNGEENPSLNTGRPEYGGSGERIRKLEIEDVSYQHAGHVGV